MSPPEPDIEGARKAMNDLLGYLDWVDTTPAARLRESNIRNLTWRALTALGDPIIERNSESAKRSRTPHPFTDAGNGFCLWCRWWPGSEAHVQRANLADLANDAQQMGTYDGLD